MAQRRRWVSPTRAHLEKGHDSSCARVDAGVKHDDSLRAPGHSSHIRGDGMRRFIVILTLGSGCYVAAAVLTAAADPPAPWAYGFTTPPAPPGTPPAAPPTPAAPAAAPDTSVHTVPGSDAKLTRQQVGNRFNVGDWFPGDHPKLPYIVQYGKAPDVLACGLCHLINGKGRPENAPVSGLPVAYFLQQLNDFRNDLRKSADPRKANTNIMVTIAKN